MKQLRTPQSGCPWDLAQTSPSIAKYTLEEAYEVVEAIEYGTSADLCEELGDLLLQVVFHAQIAEEQNIFTFDDIVTGICDKMIRRHPHVFAGAPARTKADQRSEWETVKAEERARKAGSTADGPISILADIPTALPALARAYKLQKRAAQSGFDWPSIGGVIDKLAEEVEELAEAQTAPTTDVTVQNAHIEEEFGDILFTLINTARHLEIDPERALRQANTKFTHRFEQVETAVQQSGHSFDNHDLATLESYWQAAKEQPD